jgi:hypothetical protein
LKASERVPIPSKMMHSHCSCDQSTVTEGEHLALMSSLEFARHTARWLGVACSWRGVWTVEGFARALRSGTSRTHAAHLDSEAAAAASYDVTFEVDDDERRLRVFDASGDLGTVDLCVSSMVTVVVVHARSFA